MRLQCDRRGRRQPRRYVHETRRCVRSVCFRSVASRCSSPIGSPRSPPRPARRSGNLRQLVVGALTEHPAPSGTSTVTHLRGELGRRGVGPQPAVTHPARPSGPHPVERCFCPRLGVLAPTCVHLQSLPPGPHLHVIGVRTHPQQRDVTTTNPFPGQLPQSWLFRRGPIPAGCVSPTRSHCHGQQFPSSSMGPGRISWQ